MITVKELAEIIKSNPECVAIIDNDYWWLTDKYGQELINSESMANEECVYGRGILEALALIVGIEIESV